jgi:hypothetical protein
MVVVKCFGILIEATGEGQRGARLASGDRRDRLIR